MTEHEIQSHATPTEATDGEIRYGTLLQLGFGLLALVLGSAALMYFLFAGFLAWERDREPEPPVLEEARARTPVPGALLLPVRDATGRPGPTPEQNLDAYEEASAARLGSYGWVDESRGLVHIPIDRAIALVASRGIDTVGAAEAPAATGDASVVDGAEGLEAEGGSTEVGDGE